MTSPPTRLAVEHAIRGGDLPSVGLPPANGVFDYQLGGAYRPKPVVDIVARDRTRKPAPGRYNICYVNAYQTQPGERGLWPDDALLRDAQGNLVEDEGWPGEFLLDTRTDATRAKIAGVVKNWFIQCRDKGFDAIEPDNLDSYTRSGRLLTRANNRAMAVIYVQQAHELGLAIAQKNDTAMADVGREIGFNFAIVESCQRYRECQVFRDEYGTQFYEIEYSDEGGLANFRRACATRGAAVSVTYRDHNVVPRGAPGYVFRHC